jgi:hypothetical protein
VRGNVLGLPKDALVPLVSVLDALVDLVNRFLCHFF